VLALCYLVAICVALFQEVVAWQRIYASEQTTGEVTRIMVSDCSDDDGCAHTAFVSFDASNGQSYEFTDSDLGYVVGQRVPVFYTTNNPQSASVGSKDTLWVPPLLLLGVLIWIPFYLLCTKSQPINRQRLAERAKSKGSGS